MAYCTQAEYLYLPVWEKLPFALGGKGLISKHLEVRQKYRATRRIFNSLLGVWKCAQTQFAFVFDILLFKITF